MTQPRVYTIELPAGMRLLTANDRVHWTTRRRVTSELRHAAQLLAAKAKIPSLGRIHITGILRPHDRRRRDPANWYPSFKACVDGLVDAGVIEDDDHTRVVGPDMRISSVRVPGGQLVLEIREVLT
jgi:hypothetical protein